MELLLLWTHGYGVIYTYIYLLFDLAQSRE